MDRVCDLSESGHVRFGTILLPVLIIWLKIYYCKVKGLYSLMKAVNHLKKTGYFTRKKTLGFQKGLFVTCIEFVFL